VRPLPRFPALVPLTFVVALLATMFCAALAAPLVAGLLAPIATVPTHRVFSRLTMLGIVVLTIWLLRRYGLANRQVLGFIGPWPRFVRRAAIALAAGAGVMLLALLPLFLLGVREWNNYTPGSWSAWLLLMVKGVGRGLAVALLEETFFRGAMQGTLNRMGGKWWALLAVPALYAAVHFIGRLAPPPDVGAVAGNFTPLNGLFTAFMHPAGILDAFIALWCVGLLLALARRRWGDIAGCIGLHAGFVMIITLFRKVSSPTPAGDWNFLVGSFDGLLGWWIAALALLAGIALARRPD
jgi:membrane protease YdiL (CAAX protease family)